METRCRQNKSGLTAVAVKIEGNLRSSSNTLSVGWEIPSFRYLQIVDKPCLSELSWHLTCSYEFNNVRFVVLDRIRDTGEI